MTDFPALRSLTVSDFRSIAGEWTVPLDAGAILIHGHNGAGKTSLLSALELALTGRIAHLDEAGDGEYRRHLHHRGTANGQVAVTIEPTSGEIQAATLGLDDDGTHGSSLLSPSMTEFFTERCFLPQATLARLLEIYVPRDARSADTGLIRFVKELLGLDSLDSLIEGLDATGHISRAERMSSDWQVAKALLAERESSRAESSIASTALRESLEDHRLALAARLTPGRDDAEIDELLSMASTALSDQSAQDARMAIVRESALRLDGAEAILADTDLEALNAPTDGDEVDDLRIRYADWQNARGRPLIVWALAERPDLDPSSIIDAAVLSRTLTTAMSAGADEVSLLERTLGQARELMVAQQEANARVTDLESNLIQVEAQRADVVSASTTSELSGLLASLLDHASDTVCPVCDQPFDEGNGLRAHIRHKIGELNRAAASLFELEAARSRLQRELEDAKRRVVRLDGERAASGPVNQIEERLNHLTARQAQMQALLPLAEAGEALRARLLNAEDLDASRASTRALLERAEAEIAYAAGMANISVSRGTPRQQIAGVRAALQRELNAGGRERDARAALSHHTAALRSDAADLQAAEESLAKVERAVSLLAQQLSEARRRKEAASALRKRAEELRAEISNRVFDDRLNGAWSSLFRSLVPAEPFVPQFVQRSERPRDFAVGLETVHRDGTRAASPGAMLSQGNANTAALSLFLALHFAVAPRLPWLIFDDPVQSMDDLHVSNFAALIKQLIRNNGRQVIIAVHQKELFDYLMLELSPGSPGEEVLGIRLDRSFGKTSITHTRTSFDPNDALGPLTAA